MVKTERIESPRCLKCNSVEVKTVGWRMVSGYLCKCGCYSKTTGETKQVRFIKNKSSNYLFESDFNYEE